MLKTIVLLNISEETDFFNIFIYLFVVFIDEQKVNLNVFTVTYVSFFNLLKKKIFRSQTTNF